MDNNQIYELRDRLVAKRAELKERLERINANIRRPLDADSKERALEIERHEVVDALGNEACEELSKIEAALQRVASGDFGICLTCGEVIDMNRLEAYPYAKDCIECATLGEQRKLNS